MVPTARLLRYVLSTCFPGSIFAIFPSSAHFSDMIPYIAKLISQIHHSESLPDPFFLSLRHESSHILDYLHKLVIYSYAHANSPILSLSFPPPSSANEFVSQLSFLSQLLSCSPLAKPTETRLKSNAAGFVLPHGRARPSSVPVNKKIQVSAVESAYSGLLGEHQISAALLRAKKAYAAQNTYHSVANAEDMLRYTSNDAAAVPPISASGNAAVRPVGVSKSATTVPPVGASGSAASMPRVGVSGTC